MTYPHPEALAKRGLEGRTISMPVKSGSSPRPSWGEDRAANFAQSQAMVDAWEGSQCRHSGS